MIFHRKQGCRTRKTRKQKGNNFRAFVLNAESEIDQEEVVVSSAKELYIGGGVWRKRGNQEKGECRAKREF